MKDKKVFDCHWHPSEGRTHVAWKEKKEADQKEEEDIKPYLRLARFRVGECQQLRYEEQPMSKVAIAALTSGGALRAEYPLSL